MLTFVVLNGTGSRLYQYNLKSINKTGGKTGTTQNHADGWFMSVSPDLVTATWVGGEELFIHFNTLANGGGSAMALPVYGLFMQKMEADKRIKINEDDFVRPEGFNADFDCPMKKVEEEMNDGGNNEIF
jgi:penicillin-binding protein 1A